jgi:hypothetical protein
MIISRIKGGIGNQLFIYAASRSISLRNKISLVLDDVSGFAYDYKFNRHYQLDHFNIRSRKATASERLEPFSRIRRFVKRKLNQKLPFNQRNYIQQMGTGFESKLLNFQPKGKVYLDGYWQSENYFKDVDLQIKQELRVHPPKDQKNLSMLMKIKKEVSIAIHLRFFDSSLIRSNIKLENNANTSIDYYKEAFSMMNKYFPKAHYFIFSDQPKKALNYLHIDPKKMTIIDHNQSDKMAYADLFLMLNCKHFIIAKSTFSWWGAWLSNNESKMIIAPKINKNDLSFWNHEYLLPQKWIQL